MKKSWSGPLAFLPSGINLVLVVVVGISQIIRKRQSFSTYEVKKSGTLFRLLEELGRKMKRKTYGFHVSHNLWWPLFFVFLLPDQLILMTNFD